MAALKDQLLDARRQMSSGHADGAELHARLREAAAKAAAMDEASREMAAAAEERERELAAREEQLAMLRAKLEAHADGGKAQQGQVSVLVDNLSHSRDELRVKAEQLALVRQSMVVLEQVCTCARAHARAAPPSLLSRVRHPRGAPTGARCEGGGGGPAPRAPGDPRARVRVEGR